MFQELIRDAQWRFLPQTFFLSEEVSIRAVMKASTPESCRPSSQAQDIPCGDWV